MTKRKAESDISNNPTKRNYQYNSDSNNDSNEIDSDITKVGSLRSAFEIPEPSLSTFDQCVQYYNKQQYRLAIDNTALDLDKLTKQQMALLDIRAAAYGKEAQYELGLQDAMTIIKLNPLSPIGYLRVGELHSSRGHQHHAMEIYTEGLSTIQQLQYQQLLNVQYYRAKTQLDRSIDFIKELPYDIIPNIMTRLDSITLLRSLDISKAWKIILLRECTEVWSLSKITMDGYDGFTQADLKKLTKVGEHIVDLELRNLEDNHLCDNTLIQIMRGTFKKLKSIVIYDSKIQDINKLLYAVSRVANTLTKLEISDHEDLPFVPIGTVLWMCPNLKQFRYSHKIIFPSQSIGTLGTSSLTSLTVLELSFRGFRGNCLETIIPRCPKLRILILDKCRPSTLSLIQKYCHNLKYLVFNHFNTDYSWMKYDKEDQDHNSKNNEQEKGGLQHIIISLYDLNFFIPLLNQHRHTLKKLEMSLSIFDSSHGQDFSTLAGELTSLKHLSISYTEAPNIVATLLKKTPFIKSLYFINSDLRDDNMITAITQLQFLKALHITDKCDIPMRDIQKLLRHFSSQASMDNGSSQQQQQQGQKLQEICLHDCNFIDDDLIMSLLDISSLTKIQLGNYRRITSHGINMFLKHLYRLPMINELIIDNVLVTRSGLVYLHNVKTLKKVKLIQIEGITGEDINQLRNAINGHVIHDYKPGSIRSESDMEEDYEDEDEEDEWI